MQCTGKDATALIQVQNSVTTKISACWH